jgi:hypothetical protein
MTPSARSTHNATVGETIAMHHKTMIANPASVLVPVPGSIAKPVIIPIITKINNILKNIKNS